MNKSQEDLFRSLRIVLWDGEVAVDEISDVELRISICQGAMCGGIIADSFHLLDERQRYGLDKLQ